MQLGGDRSTIGAPRRPHNRRALLLLPRPLTSSHPYPTTCRPQHTCQASTLLLHGEIRPPKTPPLEYIHASRQMRLERCLFLSCPTAFDGILNSVVPLRSGRLPLAKPGNPRARVGEDSTNVRELPLEGPGAVHARRTAAALPRSRLALDPAALRDAATHALATRCTYWQLLGRLWGYRAKCALFPPQPPSHPPQCPFPPPCHPRSRFPPLPLCGAYPFVGYCGFSQ